MGQARRKAVARQKIGNMTLDEHLKDVLGRVRSQFEPGGKKDLFKHNSFECVDNDGNVFVIPTAWNGPEQRAAVFQTLRDTFRRRGVQRYIHAAEAWQGSVEFDGSPQDDPNRTEVVIVTAVERNGPRRMLMADLEGQGSTMTLGPWEESPVKEEGRSWMLELFEEGHSDRPRAPELKAPPIPMLDFAHLGENPEQVSQVQNTVEIGDRLITVIKQELKRFGGNPWFALIPLGGVVTSVLAHYLKPKEAVKLPDGAAQILRDNPDKFPMFGEVEQPDQMPGPGAAEYQPFRDALEDFVSELDRAETPRIVIVNAFVTIYMNIAANTAGTLRTISALEFISRVLLDDLSEEERKEVEKVMEAAEKQRYRDQCCCEVALSKFLNVEPGCLIDPERQDVGECLVRQPTANGELELTPDDRDDVTYVLATWNDLERTAILIGWIKGAEGKVPRFQKNGRWLIPQEALHRDISELKKAA